MPLFGGFSKATLVSNLSAAKHRMRLHHEKKRNELDRAKKEIQSLLSSRQFDKARIRVEGVVLTERQLEAEDVLDLMCELLKARIDLIAREKDCPPDARESVHTLIWAGTRTDVDELKIVRQQLLYKYPEPFCAPALKGEGPDCAVNADVRARLLLAAPTREACIDALKAIADAGKVAFDPKDMVESRIGLSAGAGGPAGAARPAAEAGAGTGVPSSAFAAAASASACGAPGLPGGVPAGSTVLVITSGEGGGALQVQVRTVGAGEGGGFAGEGGGAGAGAAFQQQPQPQQQPPFQFPPGAGGGDPFYPPGGGLPPPGGLSYVDPYTGRALGGGGWGGDGGGGGGGGGPVHAPFLPPAPYSQPMMPFPGPYPPQGMGYPPQGMGYPPGYPGMWAGPGAPMPMPMPGPGPMAPMGPNGAPAPPFPQPVPSGPTASPGYVYGAPAPPAAADATSSSSTAAPVVVFNSGIDDDGPKKGAAAAPAPAQSLGAGPGPSQGGEGGGGGGGGGDAGGVGGGGGGDVSVESLAARLASLRTGR